MSSAIPSAQLKTVLTARRSALLSGDLAADEMAHCRHPDQGIFYAMSDMRIESLGFVEAQQPSSSIIKIVPSDATIFPLARFSKAPGTVDGLLVLNEQIKRVAMDNQEAAGALLARLRSDWLESN